jgi:hypothetical protein
VERKPILTILSITKIATNIIGKKVMTFDVKNLLKTVHGFRYKKLKR